ncbi:hypothetical protein PG989_002126 [Apiospora arundinis]
MTRLLLTAFACRQFCIQCRQYCVTAASRPELPNLQLQEKRVSLIPMCWEHVAKVKDLGTGKRGPCPSPSDFLLTKCL